MPPKDRRGSLPYFPSHPPTQHHLTVGRVAQPVAHASERQAGQPALLSLSPSNSTPPHRRTGCPTRHRCLRKTDRAACPTFPLTLHLPIFFPQQCCERHEPGNPSQRTATRPT